ncbi:hypothetical protein D3C80_1386650 [compost metagenome]
MPQIAEQEKSPLQILGENLRHIDPSLGQPLGDLDEGPAVLLRRRRIHQDQAATSALPAEIAAETGVTAGGRQRAERHLTPAAGGEQGWQLLVEPAVEKLQTYIFIRHYRGLRRR